MIQGIPRVALLVSLIGLTALTSTSVAAQTVRGTLVEEATGSPVEGGVVTLRTVAGERITGTLTRADGTFLINVPEAGRYRLEGGALGYEPVTTEPFDLGTGERIERTLRVGARPIGLEGLSVQVRPRCRPRPDATAEGQRVWDEARTALAALSATEEEGVVVFRATHYVRDVDPDGGWVVEQDVRQLRTVRSHPFRSVSVDGLLSGGFIREVADSTVYYAPDAHVLLSDAFLSTHCFWAVGDPGDDGRIGLAFEPIPDRRGLPEIEGVLWLDRETAELRTLEYTYMNLPRDWRRFGFGGEVVFRRLEAGAWVVQRWQIRAPMTATVVGSGDRRVLWVRETGGEILEVTGPELRGTFRERTGVVAGRLVSESGTPIEDAFVYLSGTEYADSTDAEGEFRMEEVREGEYALFWHHPELSGAVEAVEPRMVDVAAGAEVVARIEADGTEVVLAGGCEAAERRAGAGVVFGSARHASTAVALAGADVRMAAIGVEGGDTADVFETRADTGGEFRFCAVAPGEYVLRATLADRGFAADTVRVEPDGRVQVDLAVDLAVAAADPSQSADAGRPGRLIGRVIDGVTDEPLASASVRIDSGAVHVTDEDGRFAVEEVAPGEHRLEVTHLGFEPAEATVTVEGGALLQLDLTLGPAELEGLEVVAERSGPLADVYWRMERNAGGDFLTAEQIQRRAPVRSAQLLRDRGGWSMTTGLTGRLGRVRNRRTRCAPHVYVDGMRVTGNARLTYGIRSDSAAAESYEAVNMVSPAEIEVVEMYSGSSSLPAELGGATGQCGVIAIWLKRGS